MSQAIYVLWTVLLIVAVLALPVIVTLLHRTWKAARSIERYLSNMREAGAGIADNTGHIKVLNTTAKVADDMLQTSEDINTEAKTMERTLRERAEKQNR